MSRPQLDVQVRKIAVFFKVARSRVEKLSALFVFSPDGKTKKYRSLPSDEGIENTNK